MYCRAQVIYHFLVSNNQLLVPRFSEELFVISQNQECLAFLEMVSLVGFGMVILIRLPLWRHTQNECQAVQEQKIWEFSMQKYRRILEFKRNSISRYWEIRKGSTELYNLSFATKVCTQYKLVLYDLNLKRWVLFIFVSYLKRIWKVQNRTG